MIDRRTFISTIAGGLVAVPFGVSAQKPAMPVVGFLSLASPAQWTLYVASFRQGLSEAGYVDGKNVAIEFRWAEGDYARLPALAAGLVTRRVDLIIATGAADAAKAAKAVTSTIPIVFILGTDPRAQGIVASLARPEGNVTGISLFPIELAAKRLEYLHALMPKATVIAFIVNPNGGTADSQVESAQAQADLYGQQLQIFRASTLNDIDATFATFAQRRPDAILVGTDPLFNTMRAHFVALAARYGVPAMYPGRETVVAGGLMSYGPSFSEAYRQGGIYSGKILSGVKPSDLPVWQPTRFELVINLKTAKALGLTVPQSLLLRADEVIQ